MGSQDAANGFLFFVMVIGVLGYIFYLIERVKVLEKQLMGTKPEEQLRNTKPEVLFFPDNTLPCQSFYNRMLKRVPMVKYWTCRRVGCSRAHYGRELTSLMRIFILLHEATTSIDLCMYSFTHHHLAEFLVERRRQGIAIRFVTNAERPDVGRVGGDRVDELRKGGISTRIFKDPLHAESLMHNKFAIVDGKCLLMGSFNWTHNAVDKNHEAVILLRDSTTVSQFAAKFREIWNLCNKV